MYITEKTKNGDKGFDIKGYMWDKFGFATFPGKIDSSNFDFTKLYDKAAEAKGGMGTELYHSLKIGNEPAKFVGKYRWLVDEGAYGERATWAKVQKFTFEDPLED